MWWTVQFYFCFASAFSFRMLVLILGICIGYEVVETGRDVVTMYLFSLPHPPNLAVPKERSSLV